MASTTEAKPNAVVDLPPIQDMSEDQQCGRTCTWCGSMLLGRPSVDLGERDDADTDRHLFPRACPACVCVRVYPQLVHHTATCEQCADNAGRCPESTELRRALREGRRL